MTELEHKALDCIKNHSHTLVQNATESDIEKREMNLYIEGYKQCKREMQKENGIVWHDLRTNPDDLPKERGDYLVAFKLPNGWDTTILMYNNDEYEDEDELCWLDSEYTNYNDDVIAWCEIPKFEVEE